MPEYNIGAVAFMTNTEHTGTSAVAAYDDIKLGYKTEDKKTEGGALWEQNLSGQIISAQATYS